MCCDGLIWRGFKAMIKKVINKFSFKPNVKN